MRDVIFAFDSQNAAAVAKSAGISCYDFVPYPAQNRTMKFAPGAKLYVDHFDTRSMIPQVKLMKQDCLVIWI